MKRSKYLNLRTVLAVALLITAASAMSRPRLTPLANGGLSVDIDLCNIIFDHRGRITNQSRYCDDRDVFEARNAFQQHKNNQGGWGGGPGSIGQEVTCESHSNQYQFCRIDIPHSADVQLLRRLSSSSCTPQQDWGYQRDGIWVDHGCRAIFQIVSEGRPGHLPGNLPGSVLQQVTCESNSNRYQFCRVDMARNAEVRLARKLSSSSCTQGRDWGYQRDGIWVDHGCRAIFDVYRVGGSPGYPGGGHPPGNVGQEITCESRNNRYQFCRIDVPRRAEIRIVRRLSSSGCVIDKDWGFQGDGVWVNNGCRGVFRVVLDGGPGHIPGAGRPDTLITCESRDNRYQFCPASIPRHALVKVRDRLSRTSCVMGVNWAYQTDGIWVKDGCRAVFEVELPR